MSGQVDTAGQPVLAVENLSLSFAVEGRRTPVLRDFSLQLYPNEVVGLVGESGSGKSTALFAIMNYLAENAIIESGSVLFRGVNLLQADRATLDTFRGRRIAMVFQDPGAALNPSIPVGEQIEEVLRQHLGLAGAAARARTHELLARVRLDDPDRVFLSYPHQLSGGMRQRAMIAMALACDPDVLLMDEPTTALDVLVQAHILSLIRSLRQEVRAAILFVSHDLGAVSEIADRIGVLYAGELMEIGPAQAILADSRNPYTRGLRAAVPRLDVRTTLRGIPGAASRDPARFAHCVFAGRCPLTAEICQQQRPPLIPVAEQLSRCHFAAELEPGSSPASLPGETVFFETPQDRPLVVIEGLSVVYHRAGGLFGRNSVVRAVDGATLRLRRNGTLAVVGESGSGKSTLARTILRLEAKESGRILFDGKDVFALSGRELATYRRRVQMVFQNPTSSLNPRKTVLQLVARPLETQGFPQREVRNRVEAMLEAVGLPTAFLDRYPHRLSGGEKQRVALARAFVTEPELVILDEPTTALDVSVQATILNLLHELKARTGCAYLLISHDLAVVRQLADEIVVMRAGRICEAGTTSQVFAEPQHEYTRDLIAAVPSI